MSKITFRLSGKSISDIIQIVRLAVVKLIANVVTYATPNPTTATLTTQVDDLETKHEEALRGGRDKKELMYLSLETMLNSMASLEGYIQSASGGDAAKILLVADVKRTGSPVGLPPPPSNVRSVYGNREGEIIFRWNGVRARSGYKMQINRTPLDDTRWEDLAEPLTGKIRHVVDGLISGSNYGFRVATFNSAGISGWSDPTYHKAT
ncbi:MAG: fibronectin type III domain-containing protein [Bacteroidota bacterium]